MNAPILTHWNENLTKNAKIYYLGFLKPENLLNMRGENIVPEPFFFNSKGRTQMHIYFIDLEPDANWSHKAGYVFYSPHFNKSNSYVNAYVSHDWAPADNVKMKRLNKKDLK